ncbi:MAG TPA: hypothetical protein VL461_04520 [Dictyobacter sp.]|nr:hypothetical protein [Dictyobacter sp.]
MSNWQMFLMLAVPGRFMPMNSSGNVSHAVPANLSVFSGNAVASSVRYFIRLLEEHIGGMTGIGVPIWGRRRPD